MLFLKEVFSVKPFSVDSFISYFSHECVEACMWDMLTLVLFTRYLNP